MGCPGSHSRRTHLARAAVMALVAAGLSACSPTPVDPCVGFACESGLSCVNREGAAVCTPPTDPCGANNSCAVGEQCAVGVHGERLCLAADRCRVVRCPLGKACDKATGNCTIDRPPCENVRCPLGESCEPATGLCAPLVDRCEGICCGDYEVCDPALQDCVPDRCEDNAYSCLCGPSQQCEPITGACLDVVDRCGNCAANQFCDADRGVCVTIEAGLAETGRVGAPCTSASDCGRAGVDAFCIADGGLFGPMPGGICSASCSLSPCAGGSACVDLGIEICLDVCLENTDCRNGFACLLVDSADPRRYCFPQGSGGSHCTGAGCGTIGSGCRQDEDCVVGATCQRGGGFPGGYCQKRNCIQLGSRADCDEAREDCVCLGTGDCADSTIGLGKCNTTAQDCRLGYACYPATTAGIDGYCYPRQCEEDQDCRIQGDSCSVDRCDKVRGLCDDPCTKDADCFGGRQCEASSGHCFQNCRFASDNCGPDGICDPIARRCERRCESDAMCPPSTFCDNVSGRCNTICTDNDECRSGEFCDRTGRCRPTCAGDADCGTNEFCEGGECQMRCAGTSGCTFGQFCDNASGRCQRELRLVSVGNACGSDAECGAFNATCLTESFSGGYCTAEGCSTEVPCGVGAACVTEGGTSRCLKACDVAVQGACRAGYACETRGSTTVCVPG